MSLRVQSPLFKTGARPEKVAVEPGILLPRFWVTAWQLMSAGKSLKPKTEHTHLSHIAALYGHCDEEFGPGALDSAIGTGNASSLARMVESFYLDLVDGEEYSNSTIQRWASARLFLVRLFVFIDPGQEQFAPVSAMLHGIGNIQMSGSKVAHPLSLPQTTLEDLMEVSNPLSIRNPFGDARLRWRVHVMLQILLQAGLRRGELLLLTVDSLKQDVSRTTGRTIYWLNITTPDEPDSRASKPSVKTEDSHRQVPVSDELAELIELYVSEYRPTGDTNFLVTADGRVGLSKEAFDKNLHELTEALSPASRHLLEERTGGRKWVSSHMPRHTCATVAYKFFMTTTGDRELSFQRMRAFFGWHRKSDMPEHYANSAVKDDLVRSWAATWDRQLEALRGLTDV